MAHEEIKGLFGAEALTFEQFSEKAQAAGANFVNLAKGGYVDAGKHTRELEAARAVAVTSSKEYSDLAAERDDYKGKYDALVAENAKRDEVAKVSEKVGADFVDFIYDKTKKELAKLGNGDKTTFEQMLDKVLTDAPHYKKAAGTGNGFVKLSSSFKQDSGAGAGQGSGASSVNSAMTAAILSAAGRTPKN